MRKIFVANWKENPLTEREATRLFAATDAAARSASRVTVVACPPNIYLENIAKKKRRHAAVGAQDVSVEERGAHTGEVGSTMLKRLRVRYVIVGHSERRATGETDVTVNKKIKTALAGGLKVILCVGEPVSVRKKGMGAAKRFVKNQLRKDLKGIKIQNMDSRLRGNDKIKKLSSHVLIAYEPIWAIGTGRNDPPDDARAMAIFIKKTASSLLPYPQSVYPEGTRRAIRYPLILYGGSVNGKNIGDYVQYKEIDGALVGGASLKKDEIKKMIAALRGL
jgi:triosephosphate isomerase